MKSAPIDLTFLLGDICRGDKTKLHIYLEKININIKRYLDILPELIRQRDFDAIRTESHTLKTYLKYILCDDAVNIMTTMEQLASAGDGSGLRQTFSEKYVPTQQDLTKMLDKELLALQK